MREQENKELNRKNIRNAIDRLVAQSKRSLDKGYSVNSLPLQIHAHQTINAQMSEVVMDLATAQRIDLDSAVAMRVKSANLAARISLHGENALIYSADAALQDKEIAFFQLYLYFDPKKQVVQVETYIEVSEDYEGEDLQGLGIGSSLMPTKMYDPREDVAVSLTQQRFPEAKTVVISTGDIAHGKAGHNRDKWTTDILLEAGYIEVGNKLVKVIPL